MFKRGFNEFLDKAPDKPELYPYVYSIDFKGLITSAKKKITTQPITCSQCGAVLTDVKQIEEDPKVGLHFKCEYCGTLNVLDKETITETLPDDIDFIIEDVKKEPETEEAITKVGAAEGELYISVMDISGSMSGVKIEAVKKSLVQTIKDFKMNAPTTKFILIAFESSVYYYLKHDKESINYSGDTLYALDSMKSELQKTVSKDVLLGSIGEFADGWVRKVEQLRSMDMTALGPALYFAITTFEIFNSTGRITLLTDGLANQGIGNLSGSSTGAEEFYNQMADLCNELKIIVDVVGVSSPGDNNEMGLDILGRITDKTGGKMFFITDDEMGAAFAELQQTKYIGKDVKIKVITPQNINIKNITGAFSSKNVEESEVNLGAVTEDRQLYVEIDSASEGLKGKSEQEIPVQLQVEYRDNDGRKRMRVVNDKVKVTKDETEFKNKYDQTLNVMMNIQSAGTDYYAGKANKSKKRLTKLKSAMKAEQGTLGAGGASAVSFDEGLAYLDDELDEMEVEEEKVQSPPKASFMAAKGQERARLSEKQVKERIKRKKK